MPLKPLLSVSFSILALQISAPVHACINLMPGQKTNVSGGTEHGGNAREYSLQRLQGDNYVVGFNFQFGAQSSDRGAAGNAGAMQLQYGRCLQDLRANGYIPVTSSAGSFDIRIDSSAPVARVNVVQGGGSRSNNRAEWKQDISCVRMFHEMLHWLGLCDEYPTGQSGWSCRVMIDQQNIMGNSSSECRGLRRDQFNMVVHPNCPVNNQYVQCARNAYSCEASSPSRQSCDPNPGNQCPAEGSGFVSSLGENYNPPILGNSGGGGSALSSWAVSMSLLARAMRENQGSGISDEESLRRAHGVIPQGGNGSEPGTGGGVKGVEAVTEEPNN